MLPKALHHYAQCPCAHVNTLICTHMHIVLTNWKRTQSYSTTHMHACTDIKPFGILICYPVIRDKAFWMVAWKPIVPPVSPQCLCHFSKNKLWQDCVWVCVITALRNCMHQESDSMLQFDMAARGRSGELRRCRPCRNIHPTTLDLKNIFMTSLCFLYQPCLIMHTVCNNFALLIQSKCSVPVVENVWHDYSTA